MPLLTNVDVYFPSPKVTDRRLSDELALKAEPRRSPCSARWDEEAIETQDSANETKMDVRLKPFGENKAVRKTLTCVELVHVALRVGFNACLFPEQYFRYGNVVHEEQLL